MSEAPTAPEASKAKKKKWLELRVSALLMGVPLVFFFFAPWELSHPEDLPTWFAVPFVAMAIAGAALVALAFSPDRHRLRGVPIVGGLVLVIGLCILETLAASGHLRSGLGRLPRLLVYLWVLLPVLAMGAEMAMHRHPRSRRLAVFALVGWLGVVSVPFLPQRSEVAWRNTPMAHLVMALEREHFSLHADYLMPFVASFIGLIGVGQCLRRIGADRERAAERRFRSNVLAWLLVPVPTLVSTLWMIMLAALSHPIWVARHFFVGFGIFAPMLGGALAVRALLGTEWVRTRSLKPALVLAAIGVVALAAAIFYVARVPRGSAADAEVAALANEVGDAVAAGLRGEPVERRFLGNYSAMDLRGAPGSVALPPDARRTHVGLRVEVPSDRGSHFGYAIVDDEGQLGWVALDDDQPSAVFEPDEDVPDWLRGDEPVSGPTVWDRVPERFGSPGCLPPLEPVPDVLADHLQRGRPACNRLQLRALRGPRYVTGWVTGYVVVFANDSDAVAVGGPLTIRGHGPWIGMPRPIEDYPPPNALEKQVNDIR